VDNRVTPLIKDGACFNMLVKTSLCGHRVEWKSRAYDPFDKTSIKFDFNRWISMETGAPERMHDGSTAPRPLKGGQRGHSCP